MYKQLEGDPLMIAIKNLFATLLATILLTTIYSNPQAEIIQQVKPIHDQAWIVRDNSTRVAESISEAKVYEKALNDFEELSRQLATKLVESGTWKVFSDYYKTLDPTGKQNLELVVQGIVVALFNSEDSRGLNLQAQEYFPGYGYAKPGYTYRKGEEVGREFLYAYWKEEVIDEFTSMEKELTIEVKLLAKLKLAIPELIEGVKAEVDIDGTIHEVVKIRVKKELKIHTKQKLKLGVEKIWFKLYEAKKKWWGDLEWKYAGKTYQHDTVPTGEQVITEAEVIEPDAI